MRQQLANLLSISRMGMAPLTMSVPVMGALTLAAPLTTLQLLGLATLGLNAHIFGFALNDIIDLPLDKNVPTRRHSPLVKQQLSLRTAWGFTVLQVPLALLIYHFILKGSLSGLGLLILSIGLSVVYNMWSKWGRVPRLLPELSLAISISLLCLAGTFSITSRLSFENLCFALALLLISLLLNSVPSGLKDLKTDLMFGASSFVISMGSRMDDSDQMSISKKLWTYSIVLQSGIIICMITLIILFQPPWYIIMLISLLALYSGLHLRLVLATRSFGQLRHLRPLLNGHYNYLALSLFVIGWLPIYLQIGYGLLAIALLLIPLQLSFRVWRRRYRLVR